MLFKYNHVFSHEEFVSIGIKLISIIRYLHNNGVVHRDIRLPNVLTDNGEVYLIDFGLARYGDNNQYPYNVDFLYLGDFLLYSSYQVKEKQKKLLWYEELTLSWGQKLFLKRLLGLEMVYDDIDNIEKDYIQVFKDNSSNIL